MGYPGSLSAQTTDSIPKPGHREELPELLFRHLGVEDGLSQSTINCIYQDHFGLMWFGTQDGLNIYDGYRIKVFRNEVANPHSLSHNWIWDVIEDDSLNLWVATWEGLNKYERRTGRFIRFLPDSANPEAITGSRPASLALDPSGRLWVGIWGGGLNLYDPNDGSFHAFRGEGMPSDFIRKIFLDQEGTLWIGTWQGLWRAKKIPGTESIDQEKTSPKTENLGLERKSPQPETGEPGEAVAEASAYQEVRDSLLFEHFPPEQLSDLRITALEEDGQGRIWIGTLGGGLMRFQPDDGEFCFYRHDENQPGSISANDLTSIEADPDGRLWIGTVNQGLNLYLPGSDDFVSFQPESENTGSLASPAVFSVLKDRSGMLWVGAGGINIQSLYQEKFRRPGPYQALARMLEGETVQALYEDPQGILWAGVPNQGLVRYDPNHTSLRWYRPEPDDPSSLSHTDVTAIAGDPEGILWVATRGGGLNRLDPRTGRFTRFTEQADNPDTRGINDINGMVCDKDGVVWIATLDQGMIRFDPAKIDGSSHPHNKADPFKAYRNQPDDPQSLSGDYLLRIIQDSQGDLWLGSWGGGLNRFNKEEERFTRFMTQQDDRAALPGNIVHAIYEHQEDRELDQIRDQERQRNMDEDRDQERQRNMDENREQDRTLWVGTANGLARMDPEQPDSGFQVFPANASLPSSSVYGILDDREGQLWISTNAGLSRYRDGVLKNFGMEDGLPGNEFVAGAFVELSNGYLAFGGMEGLLVFDPRQQKESRFEPGVVLTSFSVFNEQRYQGAQLNALPTITLPYTQNFFSFEFASMDYSEPENNRFRYMLEGIDADWRDPGELHFASYTKIDPGHYTFRVRGSNSDGIWSSREARIEVVITPPFWQRWWFRMLILITVLLIFYLILTLRIRQVRDMERLRTRIASDLHDDIGAALSRISVHSQQILTTRDATRLQKASGKINELSREVVSTMSDIVWSIDARNDTTADLLGRMQDLTHSLLSESEISFRFDHKGMSERKKLKVQVRQNLYYIFKEALHNIIKHARADRVEIAVSNQSSGFMLQIADNGEGFDPKVIHRGNGLANMKMRAARIGARLEIGPRPQAENHGAGKHRDPDEKFERKPAENMAAEEPINKRAFNPGVELILHMKQL